MSSTDIWSKGNFLMCPCRSLANYSPNLLRGRLKVCTYDIHNTSEYVKKHIGGPGLLYIYSTEDNGSVHEYHIGEWLKKEHHSIAVLSTEMNKSISDYFQHVLNFNKPMRDSFMPVVRAKHNENLNFLVMESDEMPQILQRTKLDLRIAFDPNLAFALQAVGFNYDGDAWNNIWWNLLYVTSIDDVLTNTDVKGWSALKETALYPIERVCLKGEMWKMLYAYEFISGPWANAGGLNSWKMGEELKQLDLETQILTYLKEWFFQRAMLWENGAAGCVPIIQLEYRANKINPSVRQLYINFDPHWDHWYRISLVITPTLRQLFNWPESVMSKTDKNSIVLDHDNVYAGLSIDVSNILPPSYDYLRKVDIIDPASKLGKEWDEKHVTFLASEPSPPKGKETATYRFYYQHPIAPYLMNFSGTLCEDNPISNKTEICGYPKAMFHVTRHWKSVHSFDLEKTRVHISARIVAADHTSLSAETKIEAKDVPFGPSLIRNITMRLGDRIIDTSDGQYTARDTILGILRKSRVGEKMEKNTKLRYESSKEFSVTLAPFKYNTVPPNHLLTHFPLTIEIEFQPTYYFVASQPSARNAYFNLKISSVQLDLVAAPFTNELKDSLSFVRYHNIAQYNYRKWKIGTVTLPAGKMQYRTAPIFPLPSAHRFVVALGEKQPSHSGSVIVPEKEERKKWLEFRPFDLVKATVYMGNKPRTQTVYNTAMGIGHRDVPLGSDSSMCRPRQCFDNAREDNLEEINDVDFRSKKFLLCFENVIDEEVIYENAEAIRKAKNEGYSIELLFSKPLPKDITVYFMAEVFCKMELGFDGREVTYKEKKAPPVLKQGRQLPAGMKHGPYHTRKRRHAIEEYETLEWTDILEQQGAPVKGRTSEPKIIKN